MHIAITGRYGIVLCFAVYTGARIGEILALTHSDIDLDKCTINKQLTVTDPSNHKIRGIARVKSKHSNRTVPIPPPPRWLQH